MQVSSIRQRDVEGDLPADFQLLVQKRASVFLGIC